MMVIDDQSLGQHDTNKSMDFAKSEEKSNKCNQCDFASTRAGNLRTHLKTHSGENQK